MPTGPTLLFDTTFGRISCRLFSKEAPITSENFAGLAAGTKDWMDGETHQVVHGKPFFDGSALGGVSDGIVGGDRLGGGQGLAGPPVPVEKNSLTFNRAGLLAMAKPTTGAIPGMMSASMFYIVEHADLEYVGRGATIFGMCEEASIPVITAISHAMLTVENQATAPVMLNHVTVVQPGEPIPVAPAIDAVATAPLQPVPAPGSPIPAPEPKGPTALIEVTQNGAPLGTLTCRLFKEEAPVATANFIGLATGTKDWHLPTTQALVHGKKFYDGLSFRRVIPDFMIQQADMPGDPDGDGSIGYHFNNEIVPGLTFDRPGRMAYANAGPATNASEFFITEHSTHRLDGSYTIFGQCDDASVKLVETIARLPRDEHNRPLKPVVIRHVTIVPAAN
jgi:peptidyl-prolyl cis-trans isomerase A (cyclophilin A)